MTLSTESAYPNKWLQNFRLSNFIRTRCILHEQPHIIQLHRTRHKSNLPQTPGIYFIFGSYYTPENKELSLDLLTEEYTQKLMNHLGFTQKKEFFKSGLLRSGLVSYPQLIEKSKGLLYIGSTLDLSQRLKPNHQVISAIKRNALTMPYPYAPELRVQVKILQADSRIHKKLLLAIERELIDLIQPPFNSLPIYDSDDPFVYCELLEKVKPIQVFVSELTTDYITSVLVNSEDRIKNRLKPIFGVGVSTRAEYEKFMQSLEIML